MIAFEGRSNQDSSGQIASRSRKTYCVLSPQALPYARPGLQTLLRNALDPLDIVLITDSAADCEQLSQAISELANPDRHPVRILGMEELADQEASSFERRSHLRAFRQGHPCWRKITDPMLIASPGEEIIVLDPDLYFPNRFRFEPTPPTGTLLMWQRPNCLLPPEVVLTALSGEIPLARHVDIGVAHWRGPSDLDWLDWLLGKLGGAALPRAMHVEAIVWAAIAMRDGGGHLDPRYWHCWQRTPLKRIRRKLGVSGRRVLSSEPWSEMKCFHAGGEAKWWLADLEQSRSSEAPQELTQAGIPLPFTELTAGRYSREQAGKQLLHRLDYYHVLR